MSEGTSLDCSSSLWVTITAGVGCVKPIAFYPPFLTGKRSGDYSQKLAQMAEIHRASTEEGTS